MYEIITLHLILIDVKCQLYRNKAERKRIRFIQLTFNLSMLILFWIIHIHHQLTPCQPSCQAYTHLGIHALIILPSKYFKNSDLIPCLTANENDPVPHLHSLRPFSPSPSWKLLGNPLQFARQPKEEFLLQAAAKGHFEC